MSEGRKGFFGRLVEGLTKTRNSIVAGIDTIFSGFSAIDDDFYEEIEETLIMGDLGIQTTMAIMEDLRAKVKERHIKEPSDCKELLIESIRSQMDLGENAYEFENRKSVVLVIGVNGVGKTTSVGKLAGQLKGQGKKVILAAADTFRAAAIEQLTEWANRAGVDLIAQQEGSDPAAVIYDAIAAAKSRHVTGRNDNLCPARPFRSDAYFPPPRKKPLHTLLPHDIFQKNVPGNESSSLNSDKQAFHHSTPIDTHLLSARSPRYILKSPSELDFLYFYRKEFFLRY